MNAKRGFVPEDEKNFAPDAIEKMKTASRQICWLLEEGYDLKQATVFVGNHFLLSERQRLAIMRSLASERQREERRKKCVDIQDLAGREVWVDGFNTIITLEVLLSDSLLFACMDGTIRDLAALRGTYRLIPETAEAVRIMLGVLAEARVSKVHVLLDEPVSNSGRLKACIAEIAEVMENTDKAEDTDTMEDVGDTKDAGGTCPFDLDIRILRNVDRELYGKENVISSDSIVLDHCVSWFNLTGECVRRRGKSGLRVWQEER